MPAHLLRCSARLGSARLGREMLLLQNGPTRSVEQEQCPWLVLLLLLPTRSRGGWGKVLKGAFLHPYTVGALLFGR